MGCFGSTTTNSNTGTVTQSVPAWVDAAGQKAYSAAQNFYDQPYQPYTGNRVAPLTAGQNSAISTAAGTTPQRVVDEGGFLGKISDYLNPYRSAVLDPAINEINKSYDAQRKTLAGSATAANAFGDARHGIVESNLNSNQAKDIGATSGQILSQGYDTAMAQRTSDQTSFYNQLSQLLNIGGTAQQNEQNKLDTSYEAYQAQQQSPYDKLASLVSVFGATPYARTTTSSGTTTTPNNTFSGLLGSLLGGLL